MLAITSSSLTNDWTNSTQTFSHLFSPVSERHFGIFLANCPFCSQDPPNICWQLRGWELRASVQYKIRNALEFLESFRLFSSFQTKENISTYSQHEKTLINRTTFVFSEFTLALILRLNALWVCCYEKNQFFPFDKKTKLKKLSHQFDVNVVTSKQNTKFDVFRHPYRGIAVTRWFAWYVIFCIYGYITVTMKWINRIQEMRLNNKCRTCGLMTLVDTIFATMISSTPFVGRGVGW